MRYPPFVKDIVIDGEPFRHFRDIHRRHKELGGTLTENSIYMRIKKGCRTWVELNSPVGPSSDAAGRSKSKRADAAKAEMSALLRELDERKRQIKAQL